MAAHPAGEPRPPRLPADRSGPPAPRQGKGKTLHVHLPVPGWLQDFRAFIARGNVIDLAVGVVIGAAFTGIVNSVVEDLLNPVIGLLVGGIDFSNVFLVLAGERGPSLEATRASGAAVLAIGKFINAVIKFTIVAFAIFWLVRIIHRLYRHERAQQGPPPQEVLLREIRDELRAARPGVPPRAPENP